MLSGGSLPIAEGGYDTLARLILSALLALNVVPDETPTLSTESLLAVNM